MTSTNDGKEVKSNQISGPKGKTYFIELFRSLDSRLTEACSASERTKHLCEAWRRVHNLCLHSTSSAHTHLLSWLQRHTARTILQTGWQLPDRKDERASLAEAINVLIVESHTAATIRDGVSPAWETHLVSRGEWFKKVLDSPWQHPVLTCLLNPNGTPPTDDEVLEWLKEERGVTLVVRLQTLVAEKQCDDIAVSLATAVMERTRRDSHHSDVEQSVHTKDKPKETGPSFEERLKEEAGFTVDVLEMLTDIEFMLLHKRDSSRCITLAKQTPLPTAYKLIERLQSRLETSPREKRLWKNSKEVAVLIAQVVIARCMVIQQCAGVVRGALYRCAHLLARLMPSNRLPSAAAALAAPAPTAAHLHTLAAAIDAQIAQKNETSMKPFVCELYVRAITAGMNELERLKLKTEKDTEARSMEQTLASWFVQLGAVLACSNRFKCECALTAFSVHPSPQMYETIKSAPPLMPIHLESIEQASSEAANPEFGSWASDSRSQTNFVKTSETLNMKARQNQANVLSTAILNEGEALGLSPELCQDITVLLSGPRVKTLSWDMDRELLLENCRAYLERTHGGTKAVTTELKYLNLNPADFQYLPEEDEDENNIYYGIEKGYEHLVEPVPEDIWEDAYEHFETADTTYSSDEFDFIQPQRKKKTKKQVVNSEEDDPLSYIAEIKRKKERPHSKERKEKKKTDKLLGDKKIPGDPLDINVDSPDMKKDKPKKERKKKIPKPDGLLSSLVGLKVSKSRKIINCDVESDIDSQGKSPMQSTNSEDNVLYDGVFSMDEMRSPRSSHSTDSMGQMQNIELAMTNRQVGATHTHQSLISRTYRPQIVGNLRIESQSYIPQSPSVHSRNNSPTHISDDVKCSISKLLEFRRMKALECERKKPKTIIRPEGPMAIDSNISPKGVAIPEIPKSYINKQQSELLIKKQRDDLLAQRKERYAAIPSPVIQYASRNCNPGHVRQPYYNGPSEYNTTLNDRMTPSSDRCFSTPPMDKSDRFLNSVSLVSIYDKNEPCQSRNFPVKSPYSGIPNENADINYQDYLHEFYKHSAYNQYAEKKEPTKKVIRPTNRITPVVPNIKSEQKTPQCAKQMPQKKPDGSLNTFSRLSYYKNKQTDMRNRAQDMAQTNQSQTVGSKLDGFIMEHLNQSQFIDKKSPSIDAQAFERVYEKPQSTSREHPIIANILLGNLSQAHQQHAVPPQKTILSEKDQNDLVLLLRQQSLLNKPKVPLASCSKSILSTHNNLEASCAKTTSSTETYVSNPNSMPSNLSNTTTSPSNMHSNSNNMTSNPKIMSPNSSHMSRNPQICIMPLTPNNMPSNPQIRLMPTNPQTGKPNEIKKMNEKKMINIISTSILKSADSTKDPKPKPVNTKKPTCQEKHKKTESKVQKQNSAKSAVTVQKHPKEWENVMNAILKQKTPCRGPNALDMALNKSSFEKAFEESLRKPASCFEPPSTTDSVSSIEYNHEQYVKITKSRTTSSTSVTTIINTEKKTHTVVKTEIRTPRKYSKSKKSAVNKVEKMMKQHQIEPKVIQKLMQQKQIEISQKNSNISRIEIPETILKESSTTKLKTATQLHVDMPKIQTNFKPKDTRHIIDTPKKMVRQVIEPSKDAKYLEANKKEPMKQFTCAGPEQDDTCVSGIPNSDYDLLDELMDDDLRKEIGELSSDEESYNATAQDFPKENDKTDKKPINVVYNHQINDILTKASPHVSLRSVCKQNEMASSYSQKPTQQQPNNKEPTPVAAVKSAQNKPVMCLNATNVNVTTHIVTEPTQVRTYNSAVLHSTQITGQPNIYIAAVPRPNPVQNVMLIPSDLVYDGYSSVQTPIQSATNAYMNNAPAINVYQTTQFTAPVLNPIIVANAVTDPVIITPSVTVVKSKPERNANQSLYPPKDELQQPIHLATSQGNIVVDGNKLDAKVSSSVPNYDTESDMLRKHADINLNKNCERIVLKEVQEKQTVEKIDCERIRKVSEKALKIQADQERLRKKRLAILNREINYLCGVETIALSYSPLQPSNPIAEKEDDVVDKKEESTFNNEKTPATLDCYKENENEPEPVRRILLRSSNKLKNNIISPATSPKPPLDRKLKALPTNSLDKTENGTPSENDLTDIEMNLKQKRISTRIRNQSVTTPKYTKNNETKVASKVPNKRTTGTQRIRQKNKSDKNPDAVKDTTSNQDFDTEQFFDIEAELLGSTIPKIIPITTHCPSPYDACTPITIAEDIEQSLITDKEEDTSLLIQKNQQQEKYLPLNRTTLLTEHCDSLIESSDDTVTDSNTVDVIEQTIKIKDNVSEASGESVLSSVRVINKEKEKDMNDRVLKEIISQATEPVSKSIKANSQNNEVKISSQVNGPDKDLITKQPSPVEIDNPLTLKNFPNILINKKAQANEIKSVKDSSVKADNSNIKDIHCQNKSACKKMDLNKSSKIIAPQAAKNDVRTTVTLPPQLNSRKLNSPNKFNKNSIVIENVTNPDETNPLKKTVRIKLANGKIFKGTVSGSADIDTLLEDPQVKALLMSQFEQPKKLYTLKLNVNKDIFNGKRVLSTHILDKPTPQAPLETVSLLSDDEDEESPQAFITEFGKHKINSMDHNIFTKHQNKLNLKCHVLVNKLSMEENAISCRSDTKLMDNVSSNLPTQQECVIIDNANPKHQISLASSSMFVEKIDEVNVLSTIPSKYVQGIFNDIENILAPSKNIPIVEPIVLIDDSSNDSVDDNKKPEPKEKIVELKNMLLKDLGVINNSLPATTESTGDVQVTCVSEAIDLTGDLVMEPAVCSDKEKLSTLVNYQDIINRKYVVKLVRCDYMVSQSSKKSKPIEEEDDELMKPNVRPAPISRSSSFSLLEDFPDVDKISEYKIERNSPVMEVYEAIAPLNCKIPIINKHKMVTPLKCVSEWMSTKKMSKILSMNDLGRQVTSQSFIVPNLATLVLDLIQKGDLLEKYNLVPKIHTTPISLKRKLNPSTIPAAKISKMVNLQNEPQNNNCSLASTITYGWSADASIVPLNDVYDDNNLNAEIKEKPKIDSLDITPKLLDTNMTEFDMEDVTLIRNETGHEESKVINPLGENIPMTTILENSNKSGAVVYSDGNETVLAVTETQEKNINHSLDISFVSPKHHSVQLTAAHLPIDSAETSPDPDNDIPIDCSNIDFSKTNVDENCAPILMAIDSEIDSTGQIEIEDDSKNMSANSQWFPKPECMAKDSAIEVPRETSAETSPGGEPDDDIPIDCSSIDFGMEQFEENNVPISIHNSEVSPAHVEIEDDNINKMLAISESVVTTKSMVENTDQLISDADVSVCFATKISRSEILSVDIIEGLNNGVSTTQKNRNKYEPTITIEELSGSTTTKDIDKNIVVLKPISEVEDSIAKDVIGTNNSEKDNSNKGTQKIAESNEGMSVLHNSKIYKGSSEEIVYQSKNPRTLAVSKRDNLKTTTAAQKPDDIIYSDKANGKQVIKISCELQLEKCEFLDDHESANVEENRDNGLASMAEVCTENNYKTNAVIENETLGGDEKHMFEASEDIDEHHKNKALYSSNNEHDKSCTEHKEMCNLDLAISINSAKFAKGHETDNVTIMLENKKSSKLFKDCDRNNTENERSAKKLNAMNLPQTTDEIYDALHKMFGESESSQDSTDVCEIKMRINSAGNHHIDAINASLREGLALMDDSDNEILVESVVDMLSDEIIEDIAVSALASTSDVAIQTEHENLINISDSKLYSDDMNDENSASFELNAQNMLGKYINLTSEKELKVDTIQTEFENLTNIGNSKLYSDEINDENRKSIELNAKNMLGKYLNSTMEKVPQVDMKGVVSEDPEIATVFSIIDNCNDQTIEDIKLLVPKHTYTKYLATEMFRRSGRNLKRKKNMSDIKTSEKKYRKGKNIDNPKSAIAEFAYSNEYKRIINYCNTIKFSYARPFHIDYIDVHKMHKAWPIQTCHTFEIKELSNVEEVLFTDTVDTENAIALTDPMKQTLNEEIMNGNNLTDYKSIDINEINFSMGFGERSGRVIQKIETGNTKLSAATLSDVKQYQPFSKSEVSKINLNITHEKETQNVDLSRFTNLISMKEKVRAIFKKTAVELHNDLLQDKKYDTNYCHLSSLFDLTSTEYLNVPRMETVVNVVQVGQLAVSTAAQNPVTCDPRVTHVSDASPSQCSENSPGEDPQATLETEYTELTTANITLPIVQEYSQHQTTHTEEQISPETDDDPNGSTQTLSIVKIELMEEETSQEKIENDIYENDFSPLPNNNVEYSFEETSNTLFNTYGNPENTATNTNIPNNMFNSSTKFDNNFPNMYTNSSNIENTYSNMENTPSSIETTYTNMDNASTSMYSTSSNMGNSSTEMNYAANMDDSPPNMNSTKTNLNTTINIDNASTRLENPYNNMYSVGRDLNDNTTSNMGNIATNINDSPSNLENRRTTSNMDDTDIDNTAYDYSYENIEDYAKNLENNNNADNFYANNVENFARNDENYPAGVEHFDSNLENYTTNVENYAPNMNNATPSIANNLTNIDNSAVNILEESQPQDLSTGNSTQCQENETSEPNQITHAINASGISSQSVITSNANELVNLISQSTQSTSNSYSKPTSTNQHINVMTLQQALAQVLPPPLNQTSTPDNQMPNNHTVAQQVLHIVQGNNAQTVINKPNGTHLLHIVQNKNTPNANGLSLVDAGLQQGGNQLIHIVNNGNQNNAQFLKRVNLLTNLTNAQGSNEQKMIQFVCKSADGKSIQLNAGHQRSMVLRLHPTSVQTAPKPTEPQDLSASTSAPNSATSQDSQEIKSRSVYEENYAQFIQNSAPTPGPSTSPCQEKATSLPKFNQVFGKQSYQDNPNDLNHSGLQESSECPEENNGHLEQPAEANNPQLLVRNTSVETSQAPPNPVQQIKQTISPMNIHTTMHGGVIYTRQIPVNLGGGQTINLITVPSTEMVDETPQKQQTDGPFVNQEGEQSSIIKLVPHHTSNNPNATPEENNTQAASSNEPNQNPQAQPQPQPQPVLTQMRIKLPMLSKGPHIMPGTRLVRPSFFQIQRNVIAGTNQPVYQQLVLTTAPSLGQTIRLPTQQTPSAQSPQAQPILVQTTQHTQPSPHIPVQQVQHAPPSQHVHTAQHAQSAQHAHSAQLAHSAQHAQSAQQAHSAPPTPQPEHIKPDSEPDSELSTLTLEQLREFDMVLEQVKERSVQPTPSTTPSTPVLPKPAPADSTDGPALATTSVCESTQQVLYSSENNQPTNVVSYVNRKSTITSATTSFVRSPDSSGIVDTPSSSTQVQITHTVTSKSTTADGGSTAVALPKKKKKKKSSSSSSTMASLGSPTKTNSLKPQEDEQTTQRILYILAEYKEQVENSPDKNKPAPRRRNQFPPTTGSKRKRSHCSSRALCRREGVEMSPMHGEHGENGEDSLITLGSEDSSCGTTFSECTDCQESHSPEDSSTKVVRRLTFEHETTTQTITQTRTTSLPQRNVIVGDGQTITVARTTTATAAKPTTTVLMPANYLLPVSMIKGGQQIAIMTNRGPKILVGAGETNAGALLFQRLIGPGLKPVLARPGVRHIRLPATALHNLQAFNIHTTPVTQVQPPDSTASQAPTPAPPDLVDTRAMSSPWQDREARNKPDRGPSPDCTEPWNIPSSSIADDYGYEEIVRTDNMERTVLDAIPDRYSPDMEAQRIFDKMFDVDSKKSMYDSPRCGYDIDTSDGDDKPYQQVVQQRKDGRHHRVTHVSTAALRHKYAILEHELRLQKSLSEECEDLGVDSPSASDLFPEADILFGAPSPAHEQTIDQCNTPPLMPMPQSIPQPDLDDQIATDQLLTNHEPRHDDLDLNLDDVGEIVTVGEDGTATIPTINAEEFARSHPNTTFHTEPEDGEITIAQPPFTIAQGIKGRHITFHTNRVPGTVVMAPQTTVISQATVSHNDVNNTVKFTDIDNMINSMPCPQPVNIPTVLVKDPGIPLATTRPYSKFDSLKEPSVSAQRPLSKFDSLLTDAKQSTNTARHIVHSSGHGTQVIRRLRYDERTNTRTNTRFHFEEPRARSSISDEVKMRNDRAMVESMGDNASSPGQPELFWDSTTTERHERRFHFSENEKVTKSPFDELLNDSSAYGPHTRLDSVIKAARPERTYERTSFEGISVSGSDESRPLRTYPPKRVHTQHTQDTERHFTLKTTTTTTHHHELDRTTTKTHHHEVERSGKKSLPRCLESEGRRRTGRGLVKRGCGCCNGMQSSAPPKKRSRPKKPPIPDFTHNN